MNLYFYCNFTKQLLKSNKIMASFKAKTVQGVTGFALQKFILFIFGVSPIKTRYDNKSFIFFLDNSIFDKPENIPFIEKFEKDFLVKIKNIREF